MRAFLFLIFTFFTGSLFAQEMYVGTPAKFITRFPFKQLTGGIILVQARFNDIKDTFNFILDTGSGGISLDSSTAEHYHIAHIPSGKYIYGIAGVRKVDYAPNNNLSFPGLTVDSLDFYINNYDVLSSVYGIKIDGIIGYSFLSRYIVKVNYDSLKISVFEPGLIRYPNRGELLHPMFRGLPIVSLNIKDARSINSNFYFDTGAGLCFLLSERFKKDSAILKRKRRPVFVEVQGLGGKTQMQLTIIQQVQIGQYKFSRVPSYILDDENNILSYPSLGGLIGNDILRRFNLIINFPQKEIHISPNSHFRDLFDYSYTGMTMYSVDDQIIVDDVIEGSPADKAGFENGDIIVAIDNNFSKKIETYKNLLQRTAQRMPVIVMRNGTLSILQIKVGKVR